MNKRMVKVLKRSKGFTLLELAFWLAIVALGVVLVINNGSTASTKSDAANIKTTLAGVVQKIQPIFRVNFAGIANCNTLVDNGVFSKTSFTVDKTNAAAPIVLFASDPGNTVTCATAQITNPNDAISFALAGMTDEMCAAVIDEVNPLAWLISVDGTPVKTKSNPLQLAQKGTLCTNTPATQDAHTVLLTMGRANPPQ